MTRVPRAVAVTNRVRAANLPARALWAVVIGGALLRLARFVDNRSFWLDESLLGLNLIEKSTREVLRSLDYGQSAPAGFLLVEKGSIALLGDGERALRLFPFLASLAGILLFALVVRRLLPPWPALLALTLFAVNDPLLYQSSEAKPYSSDVAVALLITWLTLRTLDAPRGAFGMGAVAPLVAVGTAAVWLSYPAIFVLAAAFAALAVHAGWSGLRRSLRVIAPVGALWAISFLVLYAMSSSTIAAVSSAVFRGGDHATTRLTTLLRAGSLSFFDPGGFLPSMRGIALLCLAVGLFAMVGSHVPERAVLVIGPGALAIVAAALSKYPAGGRFWLFLTPALFVLIALGFHELTSASRRSWLIGLPLILLLTGPPVVQALAHATPKREHIRPLLQKLVHDWRPGDTLYVYPDTQYALRYYGECRDCGVARFPFPLRRAPAGAVDGRGTPTALASSPPSVMIGRAGDSWAQVRRKLDTLRGRRRVWLLFSHVRGLDGGFEVQKDGGFDEQKLIETYLDEFGLRQGSATESGAALLLYDLSRPR